MKKKSLELSELQAFRLWSHLEGIFWGRTVLMEKLWDFFGGEKSKYYQSDRRKK
ncbi:hypothetical protein LCGC14_0399010 [marine sediment metagenome]|uniref:Uncharacterized protein n=1 Tax=marine sediment metagenome TaxID=412755 RepID=A0A0F9SXD1_9ZZZZ